MYYAPGIDSEQSVGDLAGEAADTAFQNMLDKANMTFKKCHCTRKMSRIILQKSKT